MRYLVTGATGFIGSAVARQLVEAGHSVVAVVRNPAASQQLAALEVELHTGDVTHRESLRAPMRGVDGVYHVAGWYRVGARDKRPAQQVNVEGTRNVLELMLELGVPKGVYTSTLAVFSDTRGRLVDEDYRHDGPWLSEYDRTKWVARYEVAEPLIQRGLPLVIVQPGVVYGPGDRGRLRDSLVQYLRHRLPAAPKGTTFCWGHVEDTARAHLLAMERGGTGESYIIAGPVHAFVEALAMAERITGIPAPRFRLPRQGLLLTARVARVVERLAPLPEAYSAETL